MARVRARSLLAGLPLIALSALSREDPATHAVGFASITEDELLVHVTELAAPELEGRDSPSDGLHQAGEYIIGRLQAAGVQPGMPDGGFRHRYTQRHLAPVPTGCALVVTTAGPDGDAPAEFVLEEDFVPFPGCAGEAEGRLSFFGFGITETGERYDDLRGKNCDGEVVMILESEPRHRKLFEGEVVTKAGNAYTKIKSLEERGAKGVMLVRRPPAKAAKGLDGRPVPMTPLGFRHTWARWNFTGAGMQADTSVVIKIPVIELSQGAASRILGEDVGELAAKMDSSGKPVKKDRKDVRVSLRAAISEQPVPIDNIVGVVRGTDPVLAQEYVVLGAHYDHIGVDAWGRIGCGADDNGSGSAGLIEIAQAFALAPPKRSLIFVWFSAEEDGLHGSAAFCDTPPVPTSAMAAMLNVDMIGRLDEDEVFVIGTHKNPHFEDVLKAAKKLKSTQLKRVHTDKGLDLFTRSDHYNFHEKGVPSIFFTEGAVDSENPDYHVFTDTIDKLSLKKMGRITRFMFNVAWLIANDPERPPAPR
jgi:hypothetical protein